MMKVFALVEQVVRELEMLKAMSWTEFHGEDLSSEQVIAQDLMNEFESEIRSVAGSKGKEWDAVQAEFLMRRIDCISHWLV